MTLAEAQHRAATLGLAALVDPSGWCLLTVSGVEMLARGSDWESAFARLETAHAAPSCEWCDGRGNCLMCASERGSK